MNALHWSGRGRFYYDCFARTWPDEKLKFIDTRTAAAFWVLPAGIARGERLRAVADALFDPEQFYTPVPFATLSRRDLNYDPSGGYWLGSVWAPTNLAAIRGLADSGLPGRAREAARRYLEAMCAVAADPAYGSIWECYCPEAPRPATTEKGTPVAKDFVGWSGIGPVTLLVENLVGLRRDAPARTLRWFLPDEPLGLENFDFLGGRVSAVCLARGAAPGATRLRLETDVPLRLATTRPEAPGETVFEAAPGVHEWTL